MRKVRSGISNICGRYPSVKMGRTIQFESQNVELWGIYDMERDEDVLEYYDQPTRLQLRYRARSGKNTTQLQGCKKLLLGLQTDSRAAFLGAKLNPMIRVPLDALAPDEEMVLRILQEHSSTGKVVFQEQSLG